MKKILTAMLAIGALAASAQVRKAPAKKPAPAKPAAVKAGVPAAVLKTPLDSASYAFGSSIGKSLQSTGLSTLNYDILLRGIKDAFTDGKLVLDQYAAQQAIEKQIKKAGEQKFSANITEGKIFLARNKSAAGVKSTASGLQYQVLKEGTGAHPAAEDTVTVHYKGTLLNGKQFDSSYDRNEPLALPLNGVIRGWTEGVQLMSPGAKYKFWIPYDLAYGERGAGADIPPYSTLVFEIELIKIGKAADQAADQKGQ
ncbi:peptidylprolyl isomerase [Pedobacter yulinensis]|uniref:Peptidyl-prolyl cis-trans isomerase n=1 Tax=Pedobacter yulinensis TaxID=2126353 RepID=A0A2T3HP24_9SPHI|nr:FKBP-type peptidyl-prolyl cis-trans isomerase [Pedobacter yulinensis]PST84205.1 peptidylprolyl isomerase [Pedobacter yulinensis]